MIVGTGLDNKTNEPTCFPRVKRQKFGIFVRCPRGGGSFTVLVLVFAATRKDSALRAVRVGERAGRHIFILKFDFVKASYTVYFRMIASKLNGNLHDMIIF